MSAPVVVVVPWLPGCPYRERNWRWLCNSYRLPTSEAHGSVPWCKARAVMPEVARLRSEIIVVADADVWVPAEALTEAVLEVKRGAPWATPHTLVRRLSDRGTEAFIGGLDRAEEEELPYVGLEGGGIVVARREDLLSVPLDPRFVGWGQEDDCWGIALRFLLGEPWRGAATLVHLWHPPQPRMNRRRGSLESWKLRRRYYDARQTTAAMESLVMEARDDLSATDDPVHGDAQVA